MTADPSLGIDPNTGELTCTPTMPGQYAIGICVEEYRDGVLLSMVRRDFQFNVTTCEPTEIVGSRRRAVRRGRADEPGAV